MKNNQRFLVIVRRNENLPPVENEFKDIQKVTNWCEQYQKEGKLESWGLFGLAKGGYGVWTVGSMDELHLIQQTAPYAPYANWEVYSLITSDTFNKGLKEAEAHFAAAFGSRVPVGSHR